VVRPCRIFLAVTHRKFLHGIRRIILQEFPNVVVGVSPPSTESSLFSPELPPVDTAVMRALVGRWAPTGSVPGAR